MRPADTALFAADSIYFNGKITTFDADDSAASALAVKVHSILAVGSDAEIRELVGASTEVVDLRGKTVLPGINDSHMHAAITGGTRPPLTLDVGYPAVTSIAGIKASIRARVEESRPGEWIRGAGWNEGYLDKCLADRSRHLTRWDLDEVATTNTVYLVSFTQHELVANSKALEIAGIGPDTQTEPGS